MAQQQQQVCPSRPCIRAPRLHMCNFSAYVDDSVGQVLRIVCSLFIVVVYLAKT
jgi:hypothetical protein